MKNISVKRETEYYDSVYLSLNTSVDAGVILQILSKIKLSSFLVFLDRQCYFFSIEQKQGKSWLYWKFLRVGCQLFGRILRNIFRFFEGHFIGHKGYCFWLKGGKERLVKERMGKGTYWDHFSGSHRYDSRQLRKVVIFRDVLREIPRRASTNLFWEEPIAKCLDTFVPSHFLKERFS